MNHNWIKYIEMVWHNSGEFYSEALECITCGTIRYARNEKYNTYSKYDYIINGSWLVSNLDISCGEIIMEQILK